MRLINLFTFDPESQRYFLYVVTQPRGPSAPVPIFIDGKRWTYGGVSPNGESKRIRTINDFSAHDSYT